MIHFSLFSGIGGFELAAEWMGWRNYLSCEINEFGNKVREYYWPNAYHHKDIKTLNYASINEQLSTSYGLGWRDDDIILTGGFPCQPYSAAGKQLGKEDSRHLWPEMLRVISEVAPTYIVGENVYGLTNWNGGVVFEEVCADLENLGYEVQPVLLPASGIGAPHHRMRVWFVANAADTTGQRRKEWEQDNGQPDSEKSRKGMDNRFERFSNNGYATNTSDTGLERSKVGGSTGGSRSESHQLTSRFICSTWEKFPTQSPICSGDDGISRKLDGITFSKWRNESIKAYGNAVVPQLVYQIFKSIEQCRPPSTSQSTHGKTTP